MESVMRYLQIVLVLCAVGSPLGCGQNAAVATAAKAGSNVDGKQFILTAEPAGAIPVLDLKAKAAHGETVVVVVVGDVLSGKQTWVDGRAAFRLTDCSVASEVSLCTDDHCEECALQTLNASAFVKIVDGSGKPLSVDSRELLGLKGEERVVVRGLANRTEDGSVSIVAEGVYIRR